ncbi:MAG: hypothetical protein L0H73_12520, partial [Nitrococcus sp.]|nr:hypothetical protein [Nitrococcus sp.]
LPSAHAHGATSLFDRLNRGASWAESRGRRNLSTLLKSLAAELASIDSESLNDRVAGLDAAVQALEARLEDVEDEEGLNASDACHDGEIWAVEARLTDVELAILRIERELTILNDLVVELTDNVDVRKTRRQSRR